MLRLRPRRTCGIGLSTRGTRRMLTVRIATQILLDLQRQRVHAAPHVRNTRRQPHPNHTRNRIHRRARTERTRVKARPSTSPVDDHPDAAGQRDLDPARRRDIPRWRPDCPELPPGQPEAGRPVTGNRSRWYRGGGTADVRQARAVPAGRGQPGSSGSERSRSGRCGCFQARRSSAATLGKASRSGRSSPGSGQGLSMGRALRSEPQQY